MRQPVAALVGFIGKLPLAGMTLANVHVIAGLVALGYRVHYIERLNRPNQCYDPSTGVMSDDPTIALALLRDLLPRHGVGPDDYSFIDRNDECHGSGWKKLREVLRNADFLIDQADATWFDDLALCPRRAFIDADPMFTQVDMTDPGSLKARAIPNYDVLFTHGVRIGMDDCLVPVLGKEWIPAQTAVATDLWEADFASGKGRPITALLNWSSGNEVVWEGRSYGYKDREFERFVDLPRRSGWRCVAAVGGRAPRQRLEEHGWEVGSPLEATASIAAYQRFIRDSGADFGVAKHAYVAARSGWFSDRSTCYLAAGRPVLHQDTGLSGLVPTGEGVLLFSTLDEAVEGLRSIELDYERHARAARAIAQEHFEASKVLRRMLEAAGWL